MDLIDLRQSSIFSTSHCQFSDCEQLVECAEKPKPRYMVDPILQKIPSLAIYPPTDPSSSEFEKPKKVVKKQEIKQILRRPEVKPLSKPSSKPQSIKQASTPPIIVRQENKQEFHREDNKQEISKQDNKITE